MLRSILCLLSGAAALLLGGCTDRQEARPAVWVVRDADTTLYITGTVHLLPDGVDWHHGPIDRAIADADELITELSPEALAAAPATAQHYLYGPLDLSPETRFPAELRDDYRRFANAEMGRVPNMNRLDDWALALLMAQAVATDAGLEGDNGMDNGLVDTFNRAGKKHGGLETADDQFSRFDAIPQSEQRVMLHRMMAEIAAGNADDRLRETVAAWTRGDMAALAAIIDRDKAVAPGAHRLMLTERNQIWAGQLLERLKRPGTVLIAVGAGHLAGSESLIAELGARGIEARRLP